MRTLLYDNDWNTIIKNNNKINYYYFSLFANKQNNAWKVSKTFQIASSMNATSIIKYKTKYTVNRKQQKAPDKPKAENQTTTKTVTNHFTCFPSHIWINTFGANIWIKSYSMITMFTNKYIY